MLPRPTWTSTLYNTCALVFLAKQKIKCVILLIATRIRFLLMRRPWTSPRGTVASCNIVHGRTSCSKASEISECSSSSGCSGRRDFLSFNLLMNLISSQFNVLGNLNLILHIYTHSQLDRKPMKFIDLVLNVLDKFRSRNLLMVVDFFFQVFFEMTLFYRQHSSRQRMLVLQEQGTERRQWHFFLGKLSTTFFTEWIFIPIYKTQWVNLFID